MRQEKNVKKTRIVLCSLLIAFSALLGWCTSNASSENKPSVFTQISLSDEDLSTERKQSFAEWYREQSADMWFGHGTFSRNHRSKTNHKRWLSKKDIRAIPLVEKQKANARLKARLVELSMNMLEDQKKTNQLTALLKTKLEDVVSPQNYQPTLTQGDFDHLNVSNVNLIIKSLDNRFQNRSLMTSEDFDKLHEKLTPEQIAKQKKDEAENEAAEANTTKALANASPLLMETYHSELQAHAEQTRKLAELQHLLADLTSKAGYTEANIAQCGDHCAERGAGPSLPVRPTAPMA